MPYINRFPARKPRNFYSIKRKRNKSDKEKLRVKLYNLKKWKVLRASFLMTHPLCKICEDEGRITPATSCHHINSPFDEGLTDEQRIGRLLDPNNIIAICHKCHGILHQSKQKN